MLPSLEISAALFRLRVFLAFPPEFCLLLMSCLFLRCPRSTEDNDLRGKETSEPSKLSSGHCDGEVLRRLNGLCRHSLKMTVDLSPWRNLFRGSPATEGGARLIQRRRK